MIPARPSPLLKRWFAGVVESRLRKTFAEVRIWGLEHLRQAVRDQAVLFVSNHTSWWDPMFLIYLSTRLVRLDGYALMDAKNLRKLPFLGRLGGYGVDLDDPDDRSESLAYTSGLLSEPGRAVWIFPQGRERPVTERPLAFRPGAAVVASRVPSVRIIPVGLRYVFQHLEKPFMYVCMGEALEPEPEVSQGLVSQEGAVLAQLDQIDRYLCDPKAVEPPDRVLKSKRSRIGILLERMLAWMTRMRER